jgi:hypothetical protein
MGKKPKNTTKRVYLSKDVLQLAQRRAQAKGQSFNEYVSRLIVEHDRRPFENPAPLKVS